MSAAITPEARLARWNLTNFSTGDQSPVSTDIILNQE
jgi:hypothetical protein